MDESIDVGLRFGALPNSTAVARRIGAWPRVIVASPAYLKRAGIPQTPADLAAHIVIVGPSRALAPPGPSARMARQRRCGVGGSAEGDSQRSCHGRRSGRARPYFDAQRRLPKRD